MNLAERQRRVARAHPERHVGQAKLEVFVQSAQRAEFALRKLDGGLLSRKNVPEAFEEGV